MKMVTKNFKLYIRNFDLRSKVGCTSKIKINTYLFCILLGLHYLCSREKKDSHRNMALRPDICNGGDASYALSCRGKEQGFRGC